VESPAHGLFKPALLPEALKHFYIIRVKISMSKSTTVQVIIAIIPIIGIVMGSVVVFFYLLWTYKLKTLLIQTKQWTVRKFDMESFSLLAGLLLFCVGLFLTVFFGFAIGLNVGLLGGIIPLACGLSLLLFFLIKRRPGKPA